MKFKIIAGIILVLVVGYVAVTLDKSPNSNSPSESSTPASFDLGK